jgi:hypothetical protein
MRRHTKRIPTGKLLRLEFCIMCVQEYCLYPVADNFHHKAFNDASLVRPIGEPIYQEQKEHILPARKPKKPFSSTTSFADRRKTHLIL